MTKTKSRESETKGEEGTKREHRKGREKILGRKIWSGVHIERKY